MSAATATEPTTAWDFLANHAHVLMIIAGDPECRMRELATRIGITERAVQRIVAELEAAGYLEIARFGRRNRYTVTTAAPLRHALNAGLTVADLIRFARPNARPGRKQ